MRFQCRDAAPFLTTVLLSLGAVSVTEAPANTPAPAPGAKEKEAVLTTRGTGTFDVKLSPQAGDDKAEGVTPGRMSVDKVFHGDLEGTSKGEMLTAMTAVKGSAGYVAIEQVSGSLKGRIGTFTLQHSGTMTRGTQQLSVTVVPDSGTGQLAGLAGRMTIRITDGHHFCELESTLPD